MEDLYKDLISSLKRQLIRMRIASAVLLVCLAAALAAYIFK